MIFYDEKNYFCADSRSNVDITRITCFAETTVGASSGNTNTGVTFDMTAIIICIVALAVVVAVGVITAVVSKKKKNGDNK